MGEINTTFHSKTYGVTNLKLYLNALQFGNTAQIEVHLNTFQFEQCCQIEVHLNTL
jgi:hypothetical protein